jgi:Domain of unknown function (DUF1854)
MMTCSDTTIGIRWLKPQDVCASWQSDAARLNVKLEGGEEFGDARASQAFPVSAPGEMIELCDAQGETFGVLWSLAELERTTRAALQAALAARYMVPKITAIQALDETAPFVLRWRVSTDRGDRTIFTESSREAIRFQGEDGLRITDLAGDQYDLPSMSEIDARSRAQLATVI